MHCWRILVDTLALNVVGRRNTAVETTGHTRPQEHVELVPGSAGQRRGIVRGSTVARGVWVAARACLQDCACCMLDAARQQPWQQVQGMGCFECAGLYMGRALPVQDGSRPTLCVHGGREGTADSGCSTCYGDACVTANV